MIPASRATASPPAMVALLTLVACGGGRSGSSELEPLAPAPDLSGVTVMLLPVQVPAPAGLDSALQSALERLTPRTEWLGPDRLRAAVDRNQPWKLRLDALPPGVVVYGKDRRVTEPLYGHLRRLSGLTGARVALLPAQAVERSDSAGAPLQLTALLVDTFGGRVLWMGTVRGAESAGAAASGVGPVAEALARALSSP